jgi:hypothetical protein
VVGAAYSVPPLSLSKRGAVASLVLPLCVVAAPYLVGLLAADARLTPGDLALLGGLYAATIGRLLLKDFRDLRGDTLLGKRTFLVRYGRRATVRASAALCALGGATLMLAAPDRGMALVCVYVVGLAMMLWLLVRLGRSSTPRLDERLISAIAILGRFLLFALLAHLSMRSLGWTALQAALVLVALGALMLGLASDMLRLGPRVEPWDGPRAHHRGGRDHARSARTSGLASAHPGAAWTDAPRLPRRCPVSASRALGSSATGRCRAAG